jgi:hypothetical protein
MLLFLAWAVVGSLAGWLALYGFTPIGPAILLIVWLSYRLVSRFADRRLPEAYGALAGFGGWWLFLASAIDGDAGAYWVLGATLITISICLYIAAGRRRCVRSAPAA